MHKLASVFSVLKLIFVDVYQRIEFFVAEYLSCIQFKEISTIVLFILGEF